jgi:ketosteroid isomerase-like protein
MWREITMMLSILVVLSSLALAQQPSVTTASVEQEIRDLEQKYNAAYAANDLPAYFSYLAPDFIQWLGSGRTDLAKYKADWTKTIEGGSRVEAAEISDLVVKVGPSLDTAIASYLLHVKMKSADGKASDSTYQESDVLFKRGGAWKVVYLHYSAVRARPAQ